MSKFPWQFVPLIAAYAISRIWLARAKSMRRAQSRPAAPPTAGGPVGAREMEAGRLAVERLHLDQVEAGGIDPAALNKDRTLAPTSKPIDPS